MGGTGSTGNAVVCGNQIDVIVFDRVPEVLDEHVVNGSADSVHRDRRLGLLQDFGEVVRRELGGFNRWSQYLVAEVSVGVR